MNHNQLLERAKTGDIRAFHTLFAEFQPQLKSYLYRLLANRNDMEDLAQDVFIIAFENLHTFRAEASLKTWVFTIATNHARKHLKDRQRWHPDTMDQTRIYAHNHPKAYQLIDRAHREAPQGQFEVREHIDYCFTCVTQMVPLKQQICLILKDIYGFKIREIAQILEETQSVVKHSLRNARQTMINIFDDTCALVNKQGVCDQCSQLNGKFNPKQDRQAELMKIEWVRNREQHSTQALYRLRVDLVKEIDPLHTNGADLHEVFLEVNRLANLHLQKEGKAQI